MPISTSIQGSLSLGVNGGFGWALRLPAGAQWVTTENGTKYVTKTISGKEYRLYKFGTFDFTPVDIDTSAAIGALAGTFDVSSPGGYPVTLTTTDPNFSISGASLVVALPLQPVAYYVQVKATDTNGWKWTKLFSIDVDAAPVLQDVTFSKQLQIGVPVPAGTVIDGIAVGATVTSGIAGVTFNDAVRPVTVSGTPTVSGTIANAIHQSLGGQTKDSGYSVLAGAPAFTVNPVTAGPAQVGQTLSTLNGTAPGASSFARQYFRRPGTTGSGSAISGAFNPDYLQQSSDLGGQIRCRVRAFRGSLYTEYFTDWSATIVAPPVAVPVNTTPPVITSAMGAASGFNDVLTVSAPGVWSGASGGVVGQWLADNLETGVTATSFERTAAYLTATLVWRETATGDDGAHTTQNSNAIVGDAGAKTWWKALIDPEEKIDLRAGNLAFTYEDDRDYISIAGTHITADKRTGTLQYKGGRRGWVVGPNMGAKQLQITDNLWFAAMFSHDATDAESTDGFAFGGTAARPQSGVVFNSRAWGSWGPRNSWKYYGQENKAAITRFERLSLNEWRLEIAAPFPEPLTAGQAIPSARKFKIAKVPGFDPLTGPHGDFECIEVLSPTSFRLKLTTFFTIASAWNLLTRPGIGSNFTSGTAYFMGAGASAPGGYLDAQEHADALGQEDAGKEADVVIWERCTAQTAYQTIRVSQGVIYPPLFKIIDCNFTHGTARDPQEVSTQHFYSGTIRGLEVSGTYMQSRFGAPLETYGIGVTAWVNQIGNANAWSSVTVNGQKRVTNPNMVGYIIDGLAPADSCARTGSTATMPSFLGYAGPDLSRFTAVTLEKGSGTALAPGILDRIVVDYDGPEWIEWTITDIDPLVLYKQPGSRRILAGPAYVAGTEYTFTVNLTPRGSGLTKSQSVTRGG